MIIKNLIDEDFSNYKKCSMFIGFPSCTFKCEKEANCLGMCQNSTLAHSPNIDIDAQALVTRYISNPLSTAVVLGGLEPFDSYPQLLEFIQCLRTQCDDDCVIYTGYTEAEIYPLVDKLKQYSNIIIKYGRYIPNQEGVFDQILGITLASPNQYAERIS